MFVSNRRAMWREIIQSNRYKRVRVGPDYRNTVYGSHIPPLNSSGYNKQTCLCPAIPVRQACTK